MFKKTIISLLLVSYAASAHADLLESVRQSGSLLQTLNSGIKLVKGFAGGSDSGQAGTPPVAVGTASSVASKSYQPNSSSGAKSSATRRFPWHPNNNKNREAPTREDYAQQVAVQDKYTQAVQNIQESKPQKKSYKAADLAVPGQAQYDPNAADAKQQMARFKKAIAELSNKDAGAVSLTDYERLNKDIMPMLRFLKSYKDAYDPTVIVVPPMSNSTYALRGNCLDQSASIPKVGTPLKIAPATRRIDPRIMYLYQAVSRLQFEPAAARNKTQQYRFTAADIQNTLWSIRHADVVHPDSNTAKVLRAAWPDGYNVHMKYVKDYKEDTKAWNTAVAKSIADTQSGSSVSLPRGESWPKLRSYSDLGGGVVTRGEDTKADKGLSMQVVNTSNSPRSIDTLALVAEPVGSAQSLAAAYNEGSSSAPDKKEAASVKSILGELSKVGLINKDLYATMADKNGGTFQLISFVLNQVPVLGNCLNAYAAVTGYDPISGDELAPYERVLSALGTVPGMQYAKMLNGSFNPATAKFLYSAYDKTQFAASGKGWLFASYDSAMNTYASTQTISEQERWMLSKTLDRSYWDPVIKQLAAQ